VFSNSDGCQRTSSSGKCRAFDAKPVEREFPSSDTLPSEIIVTLRSQQSAATLRMARRPRLAAQAAAASLRS
jgi:hypothetical protein